MFSLPQEKVSPVNYQKRTDTARGKILWILCLKQNSSWVLFIILFWYGARRNSAKYWLAQWPCLFEIHRSNSTYWILTIHMKFITLPKSASCWVIVQSSLQVIQNSRPQSWLVVFVSEKMVTLKLNQLHVHAKILESHNTWMPPNN